MRQSSGGLLVVILAGVIVSAACGGRPTTGLGASTGLINDTQHTDAQLLALWSSAQQNLSQQIDLNPLQQQLTGAPAQILPGDPRVWNINPEQLTVASQPDVSSSALQAATGMLRTNPTGLIACPQPCNVQFAPAYSLYAQPTTRYAASWENSGNNFNTLVEYEFENHILHALGYDLTWR